MISPNAPAYGSEVRMTARHGISYTHVKTRANSLSVDVKTGLTIGMSES